MGIEVFEKMGIEVQKVGIANLRLLNICEHVVDHIEGKYAVRSWKGRITYRVLSISCISQISRNVDYYSQKFNKNYMELKHF